MNPNKTIDPKLCVVDAFHGECQISVILPSLSRVEWIVWLIGPKTQQKNHFSLPKNKKDISIKRSICAEIESSAFKFV